MPEPMDEQSRRVSRDSIIKAYKLLRSLKSNKKKLKTGKAPKRQTKKTHSDYKKDKVLKNLVTDFTKGTKRTPWQVTWIMGEMRNAMSKQDWIALHRLYPYCGIISRFYQPIRFTYAFLTCLCSHISNEINFNTFLETCIRHDVVEVGTLERIMTLQRTYHHTTTNANGGKVRQGSC